ncbi:TadE/TadG family type IV pilus assembly protein [Trichloromonas sp.]|uniref:TadE/TadG family type IV pilus assembly protein n=1 Tax=Trichloromonas sp. TaxID=3069249 RepID=UPI003D817348
MRKDKNSKGERGAAALEFALIFPLLLAIVAGITDFGIAFYNKAMVTSASREGARVASLWQPASLKPSEAELKGVVKDVLDTTLFKIGSGTIATTFDPPDPSTVPSGAYIKVTVSYAHDYLILPPIIGLLNMVTGDAFPVTVNLASSTTMRVE